MLFLLAFFKNEYHLCFNFFLNSESTRLTTYSGYKYVTINMLQIFLIQVDFCFTFRSYTDESKYYDHRPNKQVPNQA